MGMASASFLNRSVFSHSVLVVSAVTVVLSYLNRSVFSHSALAVSAGPCSPTVC